VVVGLFLFYRHCRKASGVALSLQCQYYLDSVNIMPHADTEVTPGRKP
jgi:hypothetical protein